MQKSRMGLLIVLLVIGGASATIFQNCAKAKFNDPDPVHSAFAKGLCRQCGNASGRGVECRKDLNSNFEGCVFESCISGFQLESKSCVSVVCTAGAIADCAVENGEGRKICNGDGKGYSACVAFSCNPGFELQDGLCVAVPEMVCDPGSHRDCSSVSAEGVETCNAEGSGYGACQYGDCKAGYHKDDGGQCVANLCEPNTITPCSEGVATGFKECNSIGSEWGACELNGCQPGFILQNGVCVVQVCTPGEQYVCEVHKGTGSKTCNSQGTDYSECVMEGCEHGYGAENGKCVEHKCTPTSQETCTGESGSGVKYCYENGMGYGVCKLTSCDPGFKLKNGQCVTDDSCDAGETLACTETNGSGLRSCNTNSNRWGPCVINQCNTGYVLVNQGGSSACKKSPMPALRSAARVRSLRFWPA